MPDFGPLVRTDGIPLGQSIYGADAAGGELTLWGSQNLTGASSIVAANSGADLTGGRLGDTYLGHARGENAAGGQIFMAAGDDTLGTVDGFVRIGDFAQAYGDAAILGVAGAIAIGQTDPEADSRLTVNGGTSYFMNDTVQAAFGDPDDGRIEFYDSVGAAYNGILRVDAQDVRLESLVGDLYLTADRIFADGIFEFVDPLQLPALTDAQINGLSPAAGFFLYADDHQSIAYYDGTEWREVVTRPLTT